jgi:hypothetical protein
VFPSLILVQDRPTGSFQVEASAMIHAAQRQKKQALALLVMRNGTTYYLTLQLMTG